MRALFLLLALAACRDKDPAETGRSTTRPPEPEVDSPTDPEDSGDSPDTGETAPTDTAPGPPPAEPDVWINEVSAESLYAITDDLGEPSGYVELYTDRAEDWSLDGWSLHEQRSGQSVALDGLNVPAGGHLVLWADAEPEQGETHLPFTLPAEGSRLALTDATGAERALVELGALGRDEAASRIPDGGQSWQIAWAGTPGSANIELAVEELEPVPRGDTWRVEDSGTDLGDGWIDFALDDSGWWEGAAPLGYNTGGVETRVSWGPDEESKQITTYFRGTFSVKGAEELVQTQVGFRCDDGGVVYVNEVEIGRINMPEGEISYDTVAVDAAIGDDQETYFDLPIPPGLLQEGDNLIAVEVHQWDPSTTDMIFDLELRAERISPK